MRKNETNQSSPSVPLDLSVSGDGCSSGGSSFRHVTRLVYCEDPSSPLAPAGSPCLVQHLVSSFACVTNLLCYVPSLETPQGIFVFRAESRLLSSLNTSTVPLSSQARDIQRQDAIEGGCVQLWPTLWDPVDCSPPGSSFHGILQARILE